MITFSDVGLAHLAIGASRIPRSRRRRWLMDIARQIELGEPPKPLCRSTMRTRGWRAREDAGKALLKIVVDEINLAAALVAHNRLDPNLADDRGALARAVEEMLKEFSDASQHDDAIFDSLRIRSLLTLALRKGKPRGFKLSPSPAARPRAQD